MLKEGYKMHKKERNLGKNMSNPKNTIKKKIVLCLLDDYLLAIFLTIAVYLVF